MKKFKTYFLIVALLFCLSTLIAPSTTYAKENLPTFVRSIYLHNVMLDSSKPVVFYRTGAYRGYLTLRTDSPSVPGIGHNAPGFMSYHGTVYHDSVKEIPAPLKTNPNNRTFSSIPEIIEKQTPLATVKKKWVRHIIEYRCPYAERNNECNYPTRIFYNYGGYKGYLTHLESMPVDVLPHAISVPYEGYVYTGDYYPAPSERKIIELD